MNLHVGREFKGSNGRGGSSRVQVVGEGVLMTLKGPMNRGLNLEDGYMCLRLRSWVQRQTMSPTKLVTYRRYI